MSNKKLKKKNIKLNTEQGNKRRKRPTSKQ